MELSAAIQDVTPTLQVPIKLHCEPAHLTADDRKAIYCQLRTFDDIMLLPLPEDFFDDDVVSDRGLVQLQMDAHRVGLLNKGLLEVSAEKEDVYRKRLAHKIKLLREIKGLAVTELGLETLE